MGSLSSSTNRMAPHAPPVLSSSARQAEALFSAAAASLRVAAAEALHRAEQPDESGFQIKPILVQLLNRTV